MSSNVCYNQIKCHVLFAPELPTLQKSQFLCINLRTPMQSLNFERGGISILIITDVVAGSIEPYCSTTCELLEKQPGSSGRFRLCRYSKLWSCILKLKVKPCAF
jgi:hypothetical protein